MGWEYDRGLMVQPAVGGGPDVGAAEVARLLHGTSLPAALIDDLVATAPPLWLMSAPASVLAGDVVLCHPPLGAGEVRAVVHGMTGGRSRVTVVGADRPGFLADSAAVMADAGLSITSASAASWPGRELALHTLIVKVDHLWPLEWEAVGDRLRSVAAGNGIAVDYAPKGSAQVGCAAPAPGQRLLTVSAPDQVGLLWALCRWLADNGLSVEAAHLDGAGGRAEGSLLISGNGDVSGLEAHLGGRSDGRGRSLVETVFQGPAAALRGLRRVLPR